jgi:hypothetical protein
MREQQSINLRYFCHFQKKLPNKNNHPMGKNSPNLVTLATTLGIPWRDSILQPIAPVSLVASGDDTTRPRLQGMIRASINGALYLG